MAFDVKYDKNGSVVSAAPLEDSQVVAPQPDDSRTEEAPVEEFNEVVAPQQDDYITQDVAEQEHVEAEPVVEQEESIPERNMRILRQAKKTAERERQRIQEERDEAIRRAEELERRYKQPQKTEDDDDGDDLGLGEDDLVEGRHAKKLYNEVKSLRKELKGYKSATQTQSIESRIRSEFPDFANVVTEDNLTLLRSIKPRQAALLNASNDIYTSAATAYEMISEYVLPPEDTYGPNKQVARTNSVKPRPTSSIAPQRGESPLNHANAFAHGLTPALAAQLRKEMDDSIRNR